MEKLMILNPDGDINLHTHTCFCDGKDSPEELAEKAYALGFRALGFSGHAYSIYDRDFCMRKKETASYRSCVLDLKEKYRGKMKILLGIERDYFGEGDDDPYDYVIGSLHYVKAPGGSLLSVDASEEEMVAGVEKFFGGNYRNYVEAYYETAGDVTEKNGADIVGHFDLITKFNEGGKYFDESAGWYRKAALKALAKAARNKPVFEINTGAMARGFRTSPYPAAFLLAEIRRLGCPVILSSDCHDKEQLDFGFTTILDKLK